MIMVGGEPETAARRCSAWRREPLGLDPREKLFKAVMTASSSTEREGGRGRESDVHGMEACGWRATRSLRAFVSSEEAQQGAPRAHIAALYQGHPAP